MIKNVSSSRSRNETVSVLIRLLKPSVNITQLMGFNNTGKKSLMLLMNFIKYKLYQSSL